MEKLEFDPLSNEETRLFVAGIVAHVMMKMHLTDRVQEMLNHYRDDLAFRNRVHSIVEEMVKVKSLSTSGSSAVFNLLDEYSRSGRND
jgi:hypothetical protein